MSNEPVYYKSLPKAEQKAIYKEFCKEDKLPIIVLICSIIFGISMIVVAISSIMSSDAMFFGMMIPSAMLFGVILPVQIQQKFEAWLVNKKQMQYKK